jgi:hypothetical protein
MQLFVYFEFLKTLLHPLIQWQNAELVFLPFPSLRPLVTLQIWTEIPHFSASQEQHRLHKQLQVQNNLTDSNGSFNTNTNNFTNANTNTNTNIDTNTNTNSNINTNTSTNINTNTNTNTNLLDWSYPFLTRCQLLKCVWSVKCLDVRYVTSVLLFPRYILFCCCVPQCGTAT